MKVNGKFSTTQYEHKISSNKVPVTLYIFGDVHYGSPNHCKKYWRKFLDKASKDPNAVFLGMGDYMDFASTSERDILRNRNLHESTEVTLDNLAKSLSDDFAKDIEFMRGRLLGLIEGNHHYEFKNATTSTEHLAEKIGAPYLGVAGFVRLTLNYQSCRKKLDIFAHHGTGAARTFGGSINTLDKMKEVFDADIYLMGHDHKRFAVPSTPRLYMSPQGEVKQRHIFVGRSGSFLRSYDETLPSYVVDNCLPPSSLGWIEFKLRCTKRSKPDGSRTLDMEITTTT